MGNNKKSQAMRLHKQAQQRKEKERQDKASAFLVDYGELVKKHNIEWTADLSFTAKGIVPRIRMAEAKPPVVVDWPEAQRQNLETRKECKHTIAKEATVCQMCGLEKKSWGKGDKGVTAEYEKRKRKEIKAGKPEAKPVELTAEEHEAEQTAMEKR